MKRGCFVPEIRAMELTYEEKLGDKGVFSHSVGNEKS